MKLRVGLIGLGDAWEIRHRSALRALADRFEVRAVCSEVAMRAEQAAREFDAAAVDGFRELAARDDVEAVLMLSPQWFGSLPILAACDAGKAVYCAAALDWQIEEARHVKDRVESAGVAFMAEFPRRVAPATLRLKELIATRLGKPQLLFCHYRRLIQAARNGRPKPLRGVQDGLRDLMELVDWCRYVIGEEPTSVISAGHSPHVGGPTDYQMISLEFPAAEGASGAIAQMSCGRYIPASWHEAIAFRPPASLQVCCERGIAFIDLPSKLIWFDEAGQHVESLDSERPVGEQLLMSFHRAVTSLVRQPAGLEDAYRALVIVQSAVRSAAEGRRLRLDF